MKYAIPCVNGRLSMHFGHCQEFVMIEADEKTKSIESKSSIIPPPHEPGLLPKWLHEQGADVIIAGGMGTRAQDLFQANGIRVVTGVQDATPEELVLSYMSGSLVTGANACDH